MSTESPSRARDRHARTGRGGGGTTAAEMAERLDATEDAMLRLARDGTAAREVARAYGVAFGTAMEWVRAVRARWVSEASTAEGEDRDARRRVHVERFAHLYAVALDADNPRAAIAAAERLAQLDGFLTTKVEHGGEVKHTFESPAERRARIAELQRKMMATDAGGQ